MGLFTKSEEREHAPEKSVEAARVRREHELLETIRALDGKVEVLRGLIATFKSSHLANRRCPTSLPRRHAFPIRAPP